MAGIKLGMKYGMTTVAALALLVACSHIPKPCDPEIVASKQMIEAASCRSKAEVTCPGYDKMSEEDKLKCPGVQECLDTIDKETESCNGQ